MQVMTLQEFETRKVEFVDEDGYTEEGLTIMVGSELLRGLRGNGMPNAVGIIVNKDRKNPRTVSMSKNEKVYIETKKVAEEPLQVETFDPASIALTEENLLGLKKAQLIELCDKNNVEYGNKDTAAQLREKLMDPLIGIV